MKELETIHQFGTSFLFLFFYMCSMAEGSLSCSDFENNLALSDKTDEEQAGVPLLGSHRGLLHKAKHKMAVHRNFA